MSQKLLWNTVHIKVPSEFITIGKNGIVKIKPPLTRSKKIATTNKQPAIQLETSDNIDKVTIVDSGKTDDAHVLKSNRKKSVNQKRIDIPQESAEKNLMSGEDVNRAETVHQRMARLRSLRKTKLKAEPNYENIIEDVKNSKPLRLKKQKQIKLKETHNYDDIVEEAKNLKPLKMKL